MISSLWLRAALLGLILGVPGIACAEDDCSTERPLYGLSMTGAYVAAPMLAGLAAVTPLPVLAIPIFVGTPPLVHLAYDDPGWAFASLIGSPLFAISGLLLGLSQSDCNLLQSSCDSAAATGALVGYLAWTILDVTVSSLRGTGFVHEKFKSSPPVVHPTTTPEQRSAHSFGPWLDRMQG